MQQNVTKEEKFHLKKFEGFGSREWIRITDPYHVKVVL